MNMQKGKITVLSVMFFCIMILAALMAFKYITNGVEKKQIKIEIYDAMGVSRGSQLNEARIREIVEQVLNKRSLQPLEVFSEISSKGRIRFSYKYKVTVNYFLFKRSEIVAVEDEMDNYGG